MNRFLTLLLAASCLTAVGQDTTMLCGYGITSQGGGIASWPFADIFIPSNQKAVTIYADFYRAHPQYSGSALDFSAAYCAGCSESDLVDWSPSYPNFFLWNYDTIPFPMYGTELLFDDISNSEVIGPGYLRILAPLTQVNDEWNDLCIGFLELSGCLDDQACNYSEGIMISNPESCDYSCCPGPGCCHEGTIWDSNLQQCIVANPSDSNFDGCVQLNDLLGLLSAYGDCGSEESPWQCGDPHEYQGYDYETVQIGEQCWFAENLRAENYENGDAIPSNLSDSEWENTTSGAVSVYGEGSSTCSNYSLDGDACEAEWSLNEYGRLYNWYAVDDARGLCPLGWQVPALSDWTSLTEYLDSEGAAGEQMKTIGGWTEGASGTNTSGFSGLPTGYRNHDGSYQNAGNRGYWWSTTPDLNSTAALAHYLRLTDSDDVNHFQDEVSLGFAVRCIKDAE